MICDNMGGPWEHYANKSGRERQMPYDLSYIYTHIYVCVCVSAK